MTSLYKTEQVRMEDPEKSVTKMKKVTFYLKKNCSSLQRFRPLLQILHIYLESEILKEVLKVDSGEVCMEETEDDPVGVASHVNKLFDPRVKLIVVLRHFDIHIVHKYGI